MKPKGHLIEIALKFEAGGVDEGLILRVARHLVPVKVGIRAQRPKIEVEYAVRLRKQPGGLGRGLTPQVGGQRYQQQNKQNNDDGRLSAPGHARSGLPPSSVEE